MIELLKKIHRAGIVVEVLDGELKVLGPKGFVDKDLVREIQSSRDELIIYLNRNVNSGIEQREYVEIPQCIQSENYPLSNAQYRLWVASQSIESSITYNVFNQIVLDGSYNVTCFERAIYSVIDRHEILRTVFKRDKEGEVRQHILTAGELGFKICYQDLREMPGPEDAAQADISLDSHQAFDLSKGPLIRASLFRISDDRYIFYYCMHHIISDGWSMDVLSRDVLIYYKAFLANIRPELSPLRIHYKDFAAWYLSQLTSRSFEQHKIHWLSKLSDKIPVIDLPSHKRRPDVKTYRGRRLAARISPEVTARLRSFVADRGGSLFMGLLVVLKILIYRYTGTKDIVIGNPVTGREHPDLEDQIGFYVNVLALRNQVDPGQSFIQLFDRVRDNTLESYKHQAYPFDQLVEQLDLPGDRSRSPVFDILVDYHGVSETNPGFENDQVYDLGDGMMKFDLEIDPVEVAGGVNIHIGYNSDVYEHAMVERFAVHYKRLLDVLLDGTREPVGKLDFLLEEERSKLLHGSNVNRIDYPKDKTLVHLFSEQVAKTPDAVALVFENRSVTYRDLDQQTNQLARYLLNRGVDADVLVPICFDQSLDVVVGILGVLKAGGAYVPIDPGMPLQRIEFILGDTNCRKVLTSSTLSELFKGYEENLDVIELDKLPGSLKELSAAPLDTHPEPGKLIYVIYTSGTTGVPKGVMIEHRSVTDYLYGLIDGLKKDLDIDAGCTYGLMSTPSADLGNTVLFCSLVTGGTLHTFSRDMLMKAHDLITYFDEHPVDVIKIVPSHWISLSDGNEMLLPRKAIIFGGETLPLETVNKIRHLAPSLVVINHYGPTETTIGKLIHKVDLERNYDKVPLGKPFSNSDVHILDTCQALLHKGAIGELYIGGSGLARGYLNHPDLTSEKFLPHPFEEGSRVYRTGDLVQWTPDDNIKFLGRKDHQVKIRGYRIELEEIESVLNQLDVIEQSAVLTRDNPDDTKELVAFVVSKEFGDLNSLREGLMLLLEEKLPEYMVPNIYVKLNKMPLTSNGKIDRRALPVPQVHSRRNNYEAPSNDIEIKLIEIWQQVLGTEKIGVRDDFFELGGNSLKAIKINTRIRKELNVNMEIRSVFNLKTVRDMASHISFTGRQKQILSDGELKKIDL